MEDVALSHQTQAEEHLMGVGADGRDIDANISTKFLEYLAEIDTVELAEPVSC